jgi:hypothetical protein
MYLDIQLKRISLTMIYINSDELMGNLGYLNYFILFSVLW